MAATKEELRKVRDEKEANLRSADALVIGTARSIAGLHREGSAPGQFLLDLLAAAVDRQIKAQEEAIAACDAVVAAPSLREPFASMTEEEARNWHIRRDERNGRHTP